MCETNSVSRSDALKAAASLLESDPNILSAIPIPSPDTIDETWIIRVQPKDSNIEIPTSVQVGIDTEQNPIYVQIQVIH